MTDFQTVAKNTQIASGSMKLVDLAGRDVVVANVGGAHFAFANNCTCVTNFAGHIEKERVRRPPYRRHRSPGGR